MTRRPCSSWPACGGTGPATEGAGPDASIPARHNGWMSRPATTTARAPRERSPDALGGAFIVLASLQFGGVVVLGKLVIRSGVPVSSFLAIRFGLAAAMLAVALAIVRKPLRPAPGEAGRLAVLG